MKGNLKRIWLAAALVVVLAGAAAGGWMVLRPMATATPDGCTMAKNDGGQAHSMCKGCGHDDCKGDCGKGDCDKGDCGHCDHDKDNAKDGAKDPGSSDGSTVGKDGSGDEKKDKEVIYTCPMHPQVESKVPGKCPICGMNLVPKK
jgi:hypothetical protein